MGKETYMTQKHKFYDGCHFCVYRKLTRMEYLMHYTERKAEIYIDKAGCHWLFLYGSVHMALAMKYLERLK